MDNENYIELVIDAAPALNDVLIAELAELGYEGFEEADGKLKAYLPEGQEDADGLNILLSKYQFTYSKSIIKKQNWNAVWESNFEPVQVDNFVGVRAFFHPPFEGVAHEIVITPKMSFGTGHHATTFLVMQLMKQLDFAGKSVFDFGTGTGILAILAEKLGATKVLAVDNDAWCIENASENTSVNHCSIIDIQQVDKLTIKTPFDIILANINRNIILENLAILYHGLVPGGQLILSGLLAEDERDILQACSALGLEHKVTQTKNGWIASWLYKN